MVITFAGALQHALVHCVRLNAELFSCTDSKHCRAALSRGSTGYCCFLQSGIFFSSLIDGCLKYTNKKKHKTGPRPSPCLNYDVKIGPKPGPRGVKKSGPIRPGPKCRALFSARYQSYFHYLTCTKLTEKLKIHNYIDYKKYSKLLSQLKVI